jgi:hypothetical protein
MTDQGLTFTHFKFSSQYIYLIKIFIFCAKSFNFDQTYLNTDSKCGRVKPRSNMYSIIISGKISKVLETELQENNLL